MVHYLIIFRVIILRISLNFHKLFLTKLMVKIANIEGKKINSRKSVLYKIKIQKVKTGIEKLSLKFYYPIAKCKNLINHNFEVRNKN